MAKISPDILARELVDAASVPLKEKWGGLQRYAEPEFRKLARGMARIERDRARGRLGVSEARRRIAIREKLMRSHLLAGNKASPADMRRALRAAGVVTHRALARVLH